MNHASHLSSCTTPCIQELLYPERRKRSRIIPMEGISFSEMFARKNLPVPPENHGLMPLPEQKDTYQPTPEDITMRHFYDTERYRPGPVITGASSEQIHELKHMLSRRGEYEDAYRDYVRSQLARTKSNALRIGPEEYEDWKNAEHS